MADLIRMRECSGNDVAEFTNIAHVNAAHIWTERERPAQGSVGLLLGSQRAKEVLVVKRRDDERVMRKPGCFNDPIDVGLAGRVGNVELAAADRFDIGQRRPDQVLHIGVFGGADGRPGEPCPLAPCG